MSKRAVQLFGAFSIIVLFGLTACAPTKLTKVWKDSDYTGGTLKSVMVVGISENQKNRKLFEQYFAGQFQENGVKAYTCAAVVSPDKESNKDAIKNQAERLGVDAVLVTHVVGVEEKEDYIAPTTAYIPGPERQYLGRHYSTVYNYAHQPGFSIKSQNVRLENNLYETKTEKLIWSSSSETFNPQSVNEIIESLCKVVMKSLRESNLLK